MRSFWDTFRLTPAERARRVSNGVGMPGAAISRRFERLRKADEQRVVPHSRGNAAPQLEGVVRAPAPESRRESEPVRYVSTSCPGR